MILPEPMNLTSERLERHGLYIIEDGQNVFLWIGRDAVPQLVQDVFDIPSYGELPGGKVRLCPPSSVLIFFSPRADPFLGLASTRRRPSRRSRTRSRSG